MKKKTYHKPKLPHGKVPTGWPDAETPAQRDARIKALVDGYIAKGGPITAEQLTDEVREWFNGMDKQYYYSSFKRDGYDIGEVSRWYLKLKRGYPSALNLERGQAFWREDDAIHAKLIEDGKTQMAPITPEQAKGLRIGDEFFYIQGISAPRYHVSSDKLRNNPNIQDWPCFTNGRAYFTRAAAEAAIAKRYDGVQRDTDAREQAEDDYFFDLGELVEGQMRSISEAALKKRTETETNSVINPATRMDTGGGGKRTGNDPLLKRIESLERAHGVAWDERDGQHYSLAFGREGEVQS